MDDPQPTDVPPPAQETYHLVVVRNGKDAYCSTNLTAAGLEAAVAEEYAQAARAADANRQVFAFRGERLQVVGDPVRYLVFPDGRRAHVGGEQTEGPDPDPDSGRLFPPSLRGV